MNFHVNRIKFKKKEAMELGNSSETNISLLVNIPPFKKIKASIVFTKVGSHRP